MATRRVACDMAEYGFLLPTRGAVLNSHSKQELSARLSAEVVGLAQRAESLGFRSVWIGDSVLAKPRPEPLTTLAAIGAATQSIQLGTGVYLPTLRDPVHVAHMTATVDQLSGGRLMLGMGVGRGDAVRREYANLDRSFERRGRLLDETLETITHLWTGESVDINGTLLNYEDAGIGFSPLRQPPIYLPYHAPTPGEPYPEYIQHRFVTYADGWLPNRISPEVYSTELEYIREILEANGRDSSTVQPAFYHNVVVAETEREALDEAKAFLTAYYPRFDDLTDEQVQKLGVYGPPDHVAAYLQTYIEAGVEHFVTRFTASNQAEQLDRFASLQP